MAKKEFKTMNETKRTILQGLLLVCLLLQFLFIYQLIGVVPSGEVEEKAEEIPEKIVKKLPLKAAAKQTKKKNLKSQEFLNEEDFTVVTDQYKAIITNLNGGSILSFEMHSFNKDGYKYIGGYDKNGNYSKNINLNLSVQYKILVAPF